MVADHHRIASRPFHKKLEVMNHLDPLASMFDVVPSPSGVTPTAQTNSDAAGGIFRLQIFP